MFYISSRGSSATWWLAKVLSKHPKIVCFGSTRSLPPIDPGKAFPSQKSWINTIDPKKFIQGLKICEEATKKQKIFGSTHGYHGLDIKEACEKNNAKFLYIVRHPLEKIHSAFITTAYNNFIKNNDDYKISNEDTHKFTCDKIKDLNLERLLPIKKEVKKNDLKNFAKEYFPLIYKKLKNIKDLKYNESKKVLKNKKIETLLSECFVNTIISFFFYEELLIKNCKMEDGIKMENMVSSKEYFFDKVLKKIIPDEKKDDNYLESIIGTTRVNIHRKKPLSGYEIWSTWPDNMKEIFLHLFNKHEIGKMCKNFEYDIEYLK